MASELYHEIVAQRGKLENLVAKIPGFRGYHEKNARRQADRMLRDYLVQQFNVLMDRFVKLENKILDGGKGLKHMSRTREIKSSFQAYIDRVETAAPKYSGMFASIKIDEAALDRIYAFDEAQIRFQMKIENKLDLLEDAVKSDDGDLDTALDDLEDAVSEANEAFQLRDDEILRMGDSL